MYPKSYRFIKEHKLWSNALLPGIVSLTFFIVMVYAAFSFSDDLTTWLLAKTDYQHAETTLSQILAKAVLWFIRFVMLVFFFISYKVLMINFMAPLLYVFSSMVLNRLSGKENEAPIQWGVFISELFKGIWDAIKILIKELFVIGIISIAALIIPILAPLAPFIILAVESYFIGISMVDHTAAYRGYTVEQGRKLRQQFKGLSTGVGLGFTMLFLIPLVGIIIAPSLAVTSASLGVLDIEEKVNN
jgi:CysZ protein